MTTAAIYHHPDAVESAKTPLAGRRAAGQSFLAGLARHATAEKLCCVGERAEHIEHFRELVTGYGWTGPVSGALSVESSKIAASRTFMVQGPRLSRFAWTRRRHNQRGYALCGITHTVSTRRIMDGLFEILSAPVEEWDAIICTSRAVKSVVETQIEVGAGYLAQRFGARRVPRPQLPVIPLGIDTGRFAHDAEARRRVRERLGLADDTVAVLSMGRLSVFEKLHPVPLMQALQRVAGRTGRKITLLMAGWFENPVNERLHREAADAIAPDIEVQFPDGKDPELRVAIWSAADIFTLPVDNIQETFGLAPVEAMAAGLPVVCSDWDGFRDMIEHGVTGFRARTVMARAGLGGYLAGRFESGADNYRQYLGGAQQQTVVDIGEMADAFVALAEDAGRRRAMGEAGRERARRLYDWSAVIPQYEALWAEQAARLGRGFPTSPCRPGEPANPAAMDPFALYAGYPAAILHPDMVVSADRRIEMAEIEQLILVSGVQVLARLVTPKETLLAVHQAVERHGPQSVAEIARLSGQPPVVVEQAVLWLAKFGLLRIAP